MTIKEARKLIAVLMVTFPNYKPIDADLAAGVWADAMKDYSYEQVNVALRAYISSDTSGFAPTPGKIIDKIYIINNPQELNEQEAWTLVSKAIKRSGYESVSEFAKLPPLVQKAVGQPEQLRDWALDEHYNEGVQKASFQRTYKIELDRQRELSTMPTEIRKLIENTNKNSQKAILDLKNKEAVKSSLEDKNGKIKALEANTEGSEIPERLKEQLKNILGE